jgi:hypothetical protein
MGTVPQNTVTGFVSGTVISYKELKYYQNKEPVKHYEKPFRPDTELNFINLWKNYSSRETVM